MAPLANCACQEDRSQRDCQKPPQSEGPHFSAVQLRRGDVNRQTAGKQADRQEDWNVEDIARLRTRDALADVENVGDN
jgi:hypothetical protein